MSNDERPQARAEAVHCDVCAGEVPKDPTLADALREAMAGQRVVLTVSSPARVRVVYDQLASHLPRGVTIAHATTATRIDWPVSASCGWLEIYGGRSGMSPPADLRIDLDQEPSDDGIADGGWARSDERAHHAPHRVEDTLRAAGINADQVPDSVEGVIRLLAAAPAIDDQPPSQHADTASWAAAEQRFVKVRLTPAILGSLLALQDGARVVDVYVERDPLDVRVVIAHPDAEPVPDGAEAPYAHIRGEKVVHETQRHWVEVPR